MGVYGLFGIIWELDKFLVNHDNCICGYSVECLSLLIIQIFLSPIWEKTTVIIGA